MRIGSSVGVGTALMWGGLEETRLSPLPASNYPGIHLVVQELQEVVAMSKEEPELDVKFMVHDFFKEQPVRDADVYLLRWILHNWRDKHCIQILRALIPALKTGARVLVMDFVMPPALGLPNLVHRKFRYVLLYC